MINYERLAAAQKYYSTRGYQIIEAPWIVDAQIDEITRPDDVIPFAISGRNLLDHGKHLVASGEQSFLQMIHNKEISPGKYQTITPCFRDEIIDALHQRMFMKLELIEVLGTQTTETQRQQSVESIRNDALQFFVNNGINCTIEPTDEAEFGQDLLSEQTHIELGSYGSRYHELTGHWIYGTGIAEPRFSLALQAPLL